MKKILLALVILSSCERESAEIVLPALYEAAEPVLCIKRTPKYDSLYACRDGNNRFWICSLKSYCMPADYPAQIFAVPTPKAAESTL